MAYRPALLRDSLAQGDGSYLIELLATVHGSGCLRSFIFSLLRWVRSIRLNPSPGQQGFKAEARAQDVLPCLRKLRAAPFTQRHLAAWENRKGGYSPRFHALPLNAEIVQSLEREVVHREHRDVLHQ